MDAIEVIKTFSYALENQINFVCRDLNDSDIRTRVSSGAPAIGWIIGHILVNHDLILNQRICENPLLYEELWEDFGMSTDGNFSDKHTFQEIMSSFKQLNSVIVSTLKTKDKNWLEELPNVSEFPPHWQGKNRMKVFVLHCNHAFTHTGQILEIKRLIGKGAWGF